MLHVVSLGELVGDPRFFRQHTHGMMPYPVGYTIERSVFMGADAVGRIVRTKVVLPGEADAKAHVDGVYYTASIKRGVDGGPLFQVTRSDKPDEVHSSNNPSSAWRGAFEAAERDFPTRLSELLGEKRDAQGTMTVQGQKWYGLALDNILAQLKMLPGASAVFERDKGTRRSLKKVTKSRAGSSSSTAAATETPRTRRSPRAKVTAGSSQENTPADEKPTTLKKRRGNTKGGSPEIDVDDVPFAVLAAGKNTGVVQPCPQCGLTTTFCPLTGNPHAVAEQQRRRGSMQRETAGKTATHASRKGSTSPNAGEKSPRQATRKRSRAGDVKEGVDAAADVTEGGEKKSERRMKAPKTEGPSAPAGRRGKRQLQLQLQPQSQRQEEGEAEFSDPDDVPLALRLANSVMATPPPPPPPPPPPLWRPPLATPESHKAVQVLQRLIRAEEIIHIPFTSQLRLPQVAPAKPRVLRKKGSDKDAEADQREADAGTAVDEDAAAANATAKTAKNKKSDEGNERHPLDIVEAATSLAGKRYVKFMQLYTSERTKMDLLRKADAVPAIPRTRSASKKQTDNSDAAPPPPPPPLATIQTDEEGVKEEQELQQN
ncbi:hypothetical protein DQ04_01651100 [Trypanosoma grayi]|uniref:hypothetical protein n=1 Tax=Trypanosoma grayi TaxID=71804 RepID=UPI0004F41B57|nr:hypothetical protein DQ04_01651100 [Trypanosoma grayi]KEG12519.1 hypothetical protein DQ04_01651100 [Trypanosoma grayi]